MSAHDSVIKQLNKVFVLFDKASGGGSTTLTAGAAAGATTLTVAAITSFAANDSIRVGSGETMERCDVVSAASTTITVAVPLTYNHASGEAVVEQTAFDLGAIEAGGVTVQFAGQSTDIPVSTQRLAFTSLLGYVTASMTFSLPEFTLPFFALATGIPQTAISGSGTLVSPTQLTTNGSEFAGVANVCLVAVGTKFDGSYLRSELWGVDFDYTGLNLKLSRGALSAIPVKAVAAAGGAFYTTNYGFPVDTSLVPTNGKVFDALTEVGVLVPTATTTTTTSAVSAGATVIPVAAATGIAANTWLQVGTGNTAQFFYVSSVASLNVTVRVPAYAAIANGVTVTVVTQTKFAGTSPDGVTLNVGGTFDRLTIAERRMDIGGRPGSATVGATANVIEISLANVAYALGIPQTAIANNRLPINDNLGTTGLDGFYFRGTLKDGTTAWCVCAGNVMDVSQFALAINNAGPAATIAVSPKPTSYLSLFQHP